MKQEADCNQCVHKPVCVLSPAFRLHGESVDNSYFKVKCKEYMPKTPERRFD